MYRFYIFLFTVLLSASLSAQDFNNYHPIRSIGELPAEFYSDDLLMTTVDVGNIASNATARDIKSKQDFIKYSDFYLRYLLRSGDLMFGDPLTNYVNDVAERLLKDKPEIRENFRFYVTRYPEVNAACLPNGIVLVNIGLLAQLENEAQLAFTLAHEIVHYIKKHGIESYVEQNRIRRNTGAYKNVRKSERLFAMLQYQKDLEFIADESGFRDYFSGSGYKLSEAEAMCDVLLYSEFPVDEIPLQRAMFEDEWFRIPDKYWLDTVDLISAVEDFDDEKLTHPNIKKRRERLNNLLSEYSDEGSLFILPKEEFLNIRETARFELVQLFLTDRSYVDAIYLIHVLQQKHPESLFLNSAKAKAYYGLVRLKKEKNKTAAIRSTTKIKGESQRLFHLFKSCTNKELISICAREIWKTHLLNPSDSLILGMAQETMNDLMNDCKVPENYFVFEAQVVIDSTAEMIPSDSAASKYDKIKQNQKKASLSDNFTFAFLNFASDKKFRKIFNEAASKPDPNESLIEDKHRKNYGFSDSLFKGASKILLFDPTYLRVSESKKGGDRLFATTRYEKIFVDMVIEAAKLEQIDVTLLDVSAMNNGDVDRYNEFQLIQSWINELPENDQSGNSFISANQESLNQLADDEGTNYIGFTGIYSLRATREFQMWMIYGFFIPPLYPVMAAYFLSPKYETLYYFYLYDISTGKRVYTEISVIKSRDYKYTVKNMIYTTLNRINLSGK